MESNFAKLRDHFGSHKAAAKFLAVSYNRYNEWRWNPEVIPPQGRRLIELAVDKINSVTELSHTCEQDAA